MLCEKGFRAAEVNSDSQDRAEVLEAFDRGEYNVLCNSMLLTEGWAYPSVDCVIVLRPTKIRSLYSQMVAQREKALAKQLNEMKRRKKKLVDPLQFEMSIQAEDLSGYVPSFGWEMAPPSDKQKNTFEKLGILPDEIGSTGKVAKLLERLDKRKIEGLTTPK